MLNARTAPDTPPAAKAKLKQHILLRMAELVVKGAVLSMSLARSLARACFMLMFYRESVVRTIRGDP